MRIFSAALVAFSSLLAFSPLAMAQFPPAPGTGPGLAETIEAIDSARVTTRILYVTAHPDDESAAVLTYLARGLHADVALLSLTRGEGGQNALGPEQAPQLGLIRTQELLAATRGYGVKLYFTRAKDFGYSKTPEETEKVWGDQVLEDMVRVIRTFRPNIVINGWGGVHQGHGHHQAAGLLTPKAVALAEEELQKEFDEQQRKPGVDAPKEPQREIQILDIDRFSEKPTGYVLPLDEVSPLWGKSWREIGLDAFVNHRTQGILGFISSPFLRRPIALKREDGKPFDSQTLGQPLVGMMEWKGCQKYPNSCAGLKLADDKILDARRAALQSDWATATKDLDIAQRQVNWLVPHRDIAGILWSEAQVTADDIQQRIIKAMMLAAGFMMTAEAERTDAVAGEPLKFTVKYHCRDGVECPVNGPVFTFQGVVPNAPTETDYKKGVEYSAVPKSESKDSQFRAVPEDGPKAAVTACAKVAFDDHVSYFSISCAPVVHTEAATTRAEQVPVRIVPAYTLAVEPKQEIEKLAAKHEPFNVFLRVHSYSTKSANVSVGLDVPEGWKSSGAEELSFMGEGDRYAKISVIPPKNLAAGHYTITAYAKRGEEKFTTSIEPLVSMPTLVWEEPAQTVVHAFDIRVPENLRVGYISAESEPVPDALKMLGIQVELLDANTLNFGNLSKYDAIVVGVRAYELRSELPGANQRLLDYAKNGGTLVVQYERDFAWDGKNYAPYPAKIANKQGEPLPRITDETSPVKFLKPDDPLLNTPNKITQDDFKGWVQERGLYFWSEYDSHYTPLLAMNDPGEKDLNGALLYTKLGKGMYIYTGIAFFRQLPEGVPGAYRLFVNLLSASRSH
ncbi:MAG TPA: PIG-L family deacetylase [Candidatus Dormibacteraeota bacterium]|nr:PIG-L family deacetylase [Candidatus Dormibacteraeota bacterium]